MTKAIAEEVPERSDRRSNESQNNLLSLPRQGRSREKLDRLLAAGAQLFGERGFDGTRMSDVAELGGCSVGVLYQRFADKDAFFAAVCSRWIDQTRAHFEESLEAIPASTSARQLLRVFVDDVLSLFRGDLGLIRAILVYEADRPESSASMVELAQAIADRFAGYLLEHDAVGHPEPGLAVRFALEVLRGTLVYLVLRSTEGPLGLEDERLPDELVRMLDAYLRMAG